MAWRARGAGQLAAAALCAALAACSTPPAESCGGEECVQGQRCVGGICRFTCGGNVTCPTGLQCQGDLCLPNSNAASSGNTGTSGGGTSTGFSFTVSSGPRSSSLPGNSSAVSEVGPGTSTAGGNSTSTVSGGPANSTSNPANSGTSTAGTSTAGGSTSLAGVSSGASSSVDSSSSSSALTSSSSLLTSSSSAQLDCAALANPCFTGTPNGTGGCNFTYRCPAANQVCVAPSNTCQNIPGDGATIYRGSGTCVRVPVSTTQRTLMFCAPGIDRGWFDSYLDCMDLAPGFNLATVTAQAEHDVMNAVLGGGARFWIGLSDRDNYPQACSGCATPLGEGNWFWMDGSPFNATTFGGTPGGFPWCSGEPNNNGNEDCVEFRGDMGGCWNDWDCGAAAAIDGVVCAR